MKQKALFIIFQRLSVARSCFRTESGPLKSKQQQFSLDLDISKEV